MTEAQGAPRPGSRVLEHEEVRTIVARNFWGVLSTLDPDGQPYGVPIIYGYDGAFHAVLREGRKVRNMEAHPRVCLNVVEVENGAKAWRSVVITGKVSFVDADEAMQAAIEVMRAQYPGVPTRSGASVAALREQGFRVMRLDVEEMTGRAQG